MILAIDPSVDDARLGWAQFLCGSLVACGKGPAPSPRGHQHLVIEMPRVYPRQRKRVDPNDLLVLACRVGEFKAEARRWEVEITSPYPADWKGQVDKRIHNRRVLAQLTAGETLVVMATLTKRQKEPDHNIVDAIGLGFWYVGRMGHRRAA